MLIYAIYIVAFNGELLLAEDFHSKDVKQNKSLLGMIFTVLQGIPVQLTNANLQVMSIETNNFIYHTRSFGYYYIVVVTDICNTIPENILQKVGIYFMKEYGETLATYIYDKNSFKSL